MGYIQAGQMRKISISLTKGGVGKTTTAINLAAGLALAGSEVLLIDTDTQGHSSYSLGLPPSEGLSRLIIDEIDPGEVIIEARDRLWFLDGGEDLATIRRDISRKEAGGEWTLKEALAPLENRYDFVILDTSPGWDPITINVLFYVQEILIPVSMEVLAIKSLVEFSKRLSVIRKHKDLSINYILPTYFDRRVKKSAEILDQLQTYYDHKLCAPIRYNVRLSESAGFGQTIYEHAPRSRGAEDYARLAERVRKDGGT